MKILNWIREHRYCLVLTYLIFYLTCFFLLNHFTQAKYFIHHPLDDVIPFVDAFVIPYFLWYLVMPGSLLYFLYLSKKEFLQLCFAMFTGMTICLFIYWVLPNGLNLRVEIDNSNILRLMMNQIYSIDVPANVCPSIHVSSSVAIGIAFVMSGKLKEKKLLQWSMVVITGAIAISTVFVRQHSIIDVWWGMILSLILAIPAYRSKNRFFNAME